MDLVERLARALGLSPAFMTKSLITLGIVLVWFLVTRGIRRILARTIEQSSTRFQMRRISSYVLGIIGTLVIVRVWAQGLSGIATYFGLVSAGVAIALQDPLTNFAAWLFIIMRRPIRIGDRIQIGVHIGDVVDIRPLRFLMLEVGNWVHADQSTGRVLHVPNGWIFKHPVANYDDVFPFIWNEIEITVTFESDWRKAKAILSKILDESAEKLEPDVRRQIEKSADTLHIRYQTLTPAVWTDVMDSGVKLTMRYLCRTRERRVSSCALWERVLDEFAATPAVEFAYPTIRRYDQAREGGATAAQAAHLVAHAAAQLPGTAGGPQNT